MLTTVSRSLIDGKKTCLPANLPDTGPKKTGCKADADGIEAIALGFTSQARQVSAAGAAKTAPLGGIDSLETAAPGAFAGRFDLHEYQGLSLPGNQVDLDTGETNVRRQDFKPITGKVACRPPLPQPAERPGIDSKAC